MNKQILKLIEERLLIGEKKYGNENVTNDGRDFLKESLEEALDCSVYLAALLIEINSKKKRRNKMGRAIDMENRQDSLEHRLKLVEDALEEMIQTKVHHVDLTELSNERNIKAEGVEVEPDIPPPAKRKKATHKKTVSA